LPGWLNAAEQIFFFSWIDASCKPPFLFFFLLSLLVDGRRFPLHRRLVFSRSSIRLLTARFPFPPVIPDVFCASFLAKFPLCGAKPSLDVLFLPHGHFSSSPFLKSDTFSLPLFPFSATPSRVQPILRPDRMTVFTVRKHRSLLF